MCANPEEMQNSFCQCVFITIALHYGNYVRTLHDFDGNLQVSKLFHILMFLNHINQATEVGYILIITQVL